MVLFHKYLILVNKFKNEFEVYLTCAACVFLSIKICNQLTPLRELINFFLKIYNRQTNFPLSIDDNLLIETSGKLCMMEIEILNLIGFEYDVELPYKFIFQMKSYYIDYLQNSKLITITTNFINDSFKLPLSLFYDPLLIALASLYLVSFYFKVKLPDTKEGVKWYHLLDRGISLDVIVEVAGRINTIYKFNNKTKGHKNQSVDYTQGILALSILSPGVDEDECPYDSIAHTGEIGASSTWIGNGKT